MKERKTLSFSLIVAVMLFLYTPIAVVIIMGFNRSRYNSLPFEFTTKWYKALFQNENLLIATWNSTWIAAVTGLICVILATAMVLGMRALGVRVRQNLNALILMPLAIPWLILGLSLLLMIRAAGLTKGIGFVLAGHIVVSLPYAALVLLARIKAMDPMLEEASASLGAGPVTTFRRIIMPMLAPGMVAGGFLSFMISFDNFVISYFLMPAGISSLPIEIHSSIRFGFTPEINAVSTLIICISLLCILGAGLIIGAAGTRGLFLKELS
ncbi:MAG: ABC transporter permease [Firmicutes bacterium]|nr:ABC transporter permease [Bacillota bacterium]